LRSSRILLALAVLLAAAAIAYGFMAPSSDDDAPPSPATEAGSEPAADETANAPTSFDLLRISQEGSGVIAGSAEPGTFVEVRDGGQSVGKARAAEDGSWEFVLDQPMSPGVHILDLVAAGATGGETESSRVALVAVPEAADEESDDTEGVVVLLDNRNGNGASTVVQRPGPLEPKLDLGLDSVDFSASRDAVLSGFAPANTTLRVYLNDIYAGEVAVDSKGRWQLAPSDPVPEANIRLRLDQIDDEGAVTARAIQQFDPSSALTLTPQRGVPLVERQEASWSLARVLPGGGIRYTQIFRKNLAESAEPGDIYPGQHFEDNERFGPPGQN
jgi:hypothetical protein